MPWTESPLQTLEKHLGTKFPNMRACYERSEEKLAELQKIVGDQLPAQGSFVVLGSLARKEFTSGSDLDWCLMIDGRADSAHRELERDLKEALARSKKFKNPNSAGAFGALVFGHELIHCIGGMQDTNANLTRRMLLLLESASVDPDQGVSPRERLMRGVLQRYFEEEAHFTGTKFFPRFFLNDVVRYWRTIAVDYAAKNSERGAKGWALRNVKLRFSRKLLFIAGLLLTYETTLFPESELIPPKSEPELPLFDEGKPQFSSTEHCYHALKLTPLELLARACLKLRLPKKDVRVIFTSYDQFLGVLESEPQREALAALSFQEADKNEAFQKIRTLSRHFQSALSRQFLNPESKLGELTLKFAIF